MRLVRSWPARIPAGRAHVVDGIDRLVMENYDYRVLADVDDDVVLLEWDIAVGRGDLVAFVDACRSAPDRVRVAPYPIEVSMTDRRYPFHPLWPFRRYVTTDNVRWCETGEPTCHLFGFGMVYLPRQLVTGFCGFWDGHFDDVAFSGWHYKNAADPEVPIMWDCRPVHLHYPLEGVLDVRRRTDPSAAA